ncbi:Uncharacterised protein [Streptococcus pyogenes]|nr:Uncharacterised protein [Streptococcus pyogenes]
MAELIQGKSFLLFFRRFADAKKTKCCKIAIPNRTFY